MKKFTVSILALLLLSVHCRAADQEMVEIAVSGLACPFCAYSLEKSLTSLPEVESAAVNLAANSARVAIKPGHTADLEQIKQAVVKAGFTPGDSTRSIEHK